jgi:hypothetical protein
VSSESLFIDVNSAMLEVVVSVMQTRVGSLGLQLKTAAGTPITDTTFSIYNNAQFIQENLSDSSGHVLFDGI